MNEQNYEQLIYQLMTLENSGNFAISIFEDQIIVKSKFYKGELFILPSETNVNSYDVKSYNGNSSLYDSETIKSDLTSLKKAIYYLNKKKD